MGGCVSTQKRGHDPFLPSSSMPGMAGNNSVSIPGGSGAINRYDGTPKMYHVNSGSSGIQTSGRMLDSPRIERQQSNQQTQQVVSLIALYNYESRSEGDLSFEKGDVMMLIDGSNSDWWYVRNEKTMESGYVPRNFVAKFKTLESEEWFAGRIARSQAERLVSRQNLPKGTFLIRERETEPLEYALTIRDEINQKGLNVKHYKIKRLDNDEGYYITPRIKFRSLKELVSYYSERADGLCGMLTFPAPKIAPTRPELSRETQNNWEIPRDQLELRERLDGGNFGEVWKGKWRGIVDVAIKTLKPGTMTPEAFLGEAQIMKQCDHPNLVKLYAVCTQDEPFYIITEFMEGGSLQQFLRNDKNQLSVQAMIDICGQIANGMKYLEERKLVHRDLAARNVLVGVKISGVPVVKVADFGLARKLMEEEIYEATVGAKFPIKWTAPEAASSGNFNVKSDIWSYGVLLCEIFSRGQVPYAGMHNREVLEQVERGYRMPQPKNCPQNVYHDVILKCWDKIPENRPTFAFLFSYFDDFFVSSQHSYAPPLNFT
jgi:tyrosine-protein kinase Src